MGRRAALVTGVSRRQGIAHTIARQLHADGLDVLTTGWEPHDARHPWGADDNAAMRGELPNGVDWVAADLADADVPARLVDDAVARFGGVDVLVATHARSCVASLADTTAAELDVSWAVNVRSIVLLAQRFAAVSGTSGATGEHAHRRIVTFTSGQHHGGMPGEVPYAVTKGAVQQLTATLALGLVRDGVTVNCVNPGPNDTGWPDDETREFVTTRLPAGRWGTPGDTAELVSWLASPASAWVTGQTLVSDGGWSIR